MKTEGKTDAGMPEKRHKPRHKPGFRGPSPDVGMATRFKPGQSGNAGGRPKSKLLSEAYRKLLGELVPGDKEGRTYAEAIAAKMVELAMKGKYMHASEIADRVEGKPRQAYDVELSVNDELAEIVEKARKRAAK